jgi:CheY-like chemotaxis protein
VKILVTEDFSPSRDLLAMQLEAAGHDVATAATGQQALAMLSQEPYDLLLLDMRMPVMGGGCVLDAIRDWKEKPVVVVITAVPDPNLAIHPGEVFAVLHKPWEMSELEAVLARIPQKGGAS